MTSRRLTISFPKIHEEEWKYIQGLKGKKNISVYICELIRKDIQQGNNLEERIARIIESKLNGISITRGNRQPDKLTAVDDELKNAADAFDF